MSKPDVVNEGTSVVSMDKVPEPPAGMRRSRASDIYGDVRKLAPDGTEALRIPCRDAGDLSYLRSRLRKIAEQDGRRLLTSRNQDSTVLFAWLAKKEK